MAADTSATPREASASPPPAEAAVISADRIGRSFVKEYYKALNTDPKQVHVFYGEDSVFCRVGEEQKFTNDLNLTGQDAIHEQLTSSALEGCKVKIDHMESQYSVNRSLLVIVHGHLWNLGWDSAKTFVQSFVLAPIGQAGYYVRNDILRYTGDVAAQPAQQDAAAPAAAARQEDGPAGAEAEAEKAAEDEAEPAAKAEPAADEPEAAAEPVVAAAEPQEEAAAAEAEAAAEEAEAVEEEEAEEEEEEAAPAAAAAAAAAATKPTKGPMRKEKKEEAPAAAAAPAQEKPKAAAENRAAADNSAATAAAKASWATRLFKNVPEKAAPAAAPAAASESPAGAEASAEPAGAEAEADRAGQAGKAKGKAVAGRKTGKDERGSRPSSSGRAPVSAAAAECQLFVSGYADGTTPEALKGFFAAHGRVEEIVTVPGKPFCFVRFSSAAGVTAAMESQPAVLEGRELKVDRRRAETRPRSSGNRGGRARSGRSAARRSVSDVEVDGDGENAFKTVRGRGKRGQVGAGAGPGAGQRRARGGASSGRGRK